MTKLESTLSTWQQMQPLTDEQRKQLERKFTLEFNYNSNNIEGNMLTYGETELLLMFGKVVGDNNERYVREMKASNVGLLLMLQEAEDKEKPLTESFIRSLHHTLLVEDYEVHRQDKFGNTFEYTVHAGIYKTRPNSVITVTGERFEYSSPEETPALMTDLVSWYNQAEQSDDYTPVELASVLHYRYIRIHPFEDGNGRIARLLVNYVLHRHGYPMMVIRSNKKEQYLKALNHCDKIVGALPSTGTNADLKQLKAFVRYMEQSLEDEVSTNIRILTEASRDLWLYNGDLVTFRSENTVRILEAMQADGKVSVRALTEMLGINKSAIQKQIKSLQDKGYIMREGGQKGIWQVIIYCTTK